MWAIFGGLGSKNCTSANFTAFCRRVYYCSCVAISWNIVFVHQQLLSLLKLTIGYYVLDRRKTLVSRIFCHLLVSATIWTWSVIIQFDKISTNGRVTNICTRINDNKVNKSSWIILWSLVVMSRVCLPLVNSNRQLSIWLHTRWCRRFFNIKFYLHLFISVFNFTMSHQFLSSWKNE